MEYTNNIEDFKNIDFEEINKLEETIMEYCSTLKSADDILKHLGGDHTLESLQETLYDMVDTGLLLLRYPSKIDHKNQKYKKNRSQKEETKQTRRVLELINKFNRGEKVCIKKLQDDAQEAYDYNGSEVDKLWFNESTKNNNGKPQPMSEKSIRRDLDIIKFHFPRAFELIRGETGCYKPLNRKIYDNFLEPENLSLLIQTFNIAQRSNLFDSFDIGDDDKKILQKKVKEKNEVYEFINKPFENLEKSRKYFNIIEESIKNRETLLIEYEQNSKKIVKIEIQPYKILFMNENFYLGAGVDSEHLYSTFRIAKIIDLKPLGKRFLRDPDIEQFVSEVQTPFPRYIPHYRQHLIDVQVEVESAKADFFKNKNFLKSQKVLEEKDNGNLIVTYKVTQEMEVESLIKSWLPHIKVISPLSLKEKIENELRSYLE